MSSVKLKHSSGNGTIINGPVANPSADITLKVPSTTGTAGQVLAVASANHSSTNAELEWVANSAGSGRKVLEEFYSVCDGSVIALQDGNHTLTQPTVYDTTDSFVDVVGSSISYTPPAGTTQVVYEYSLQVSYSNGGPILSFALYLDSDEVTNFRFVRRASDDLEDRLIIKWGFNIGGEASTANGRVASWTSAKTIKVQVCRFSSSYAGRLHETNHWGTTSTDMTVLPCVGIKAIG